MGYTQKNMLFFTELRFFRSVKLEQTLNGVVIPQSWQSHTMATGTSVVSHWYGLSQSI